MSKKRKGGITEKEDCKILAGQTDENVRHALKTAIEQFECPVCLQLPSMSKLITACKEQNHFVCTDCATKLTKCPLKCGSNIVCNDTAGAITLKKIFCALTQYTSFECEYTQQGCKASVLGKDMEKHNEQCAFGPSNCIGMLCGLKFPYKNFVEKPLLHPGREKNLCYQIVKNVATKPRTWVVFVPFQSIESIALLYCSNKTLFFSQLFTNKVKDDCIRLGLQLYLENNVFCARPVWMENLEAAKQTRPEPVNVKVTAGCTSKNNTSAHQSYEGTPTFQDSPRHKDRHFVDASHLLQLKTAELSMFCCKTPCNTCKKMSFTPMLVLTIELLGGNKKHDKM